MVRPDDADAPPPPHDPAMFDFGARPGRQETGSARARRPHTWVAAAILALVTSLVPASPLASVARASGETTASPRYIAGALARQLGKEGEALAGIDQAAKVRIPSLTDTAAYRIPDELTATTLPCRDGRVCQTVSTCCGDGKTAGCCDPVYRCCMRTSRRATTVSVTSGAF